jgi:uncharacterized protein
MGECTLAFAFEALFIELNGLGFRTDKRLVVNQGGENQMNLIVAPSSKRDLMSSNSHRALIQRVCRKVAPLFELRETVAVNPFLGSTEETLLDAAFELEATFHTELLPSQKDLSEAFLRGEFGVEHLEFAASHLTLSRTGVPAVTANDFLCYTTFESKSPLGPRTMTVADIAVEVLGPEVGNAPLRSLARFLAARMDRNVALVDSPFRRRSLYEAYQRFAEHDRSVDAAGLKGFRKFVQSVSQSRDELLVSQIPQIEFQFPQIELYFVRLLSRILGYASLLRGAVFRGNAESVGELPDLLAILLLQELALKTLTPVPLEAQLRPESPGFEEDRARRYLGLRAMEHAHALSIAQKLHVTGEKPLPKAQAVFCIDVRSERVRRALESVYPVETYGMAGFFGIPLLVRDPNGDRNQCPPLLIPKVSAESNPVGRAGLGRHFQLNAIAHLPVTSFSYVEAFGVTYLAKLAGDSLGRSSRGAARAESLTTDMALETRVELAHSILKSSGLGFPLAPIVVMVGHVSHVTNNPLAAGLGCGACAGHSGASNARLAAQLLNDPDVRTELGKRGIGSFEHVLFLAAEHDTSSDDVRLLDVEQVSAKHGDNLRALEKAFARAGEMACEERFQGQSSQGSRGQNKKAQAIARSKAASIAETQPEWGLAGNATFIVGRRKLSEHIDLGGRAFLHTYDSSRDADGSLLEMILTAPGIVTSWINLQYYASTVSPETFGSGYKTLHNVTGNIGVVEGGTGDIRVGLSRESLFRGDKPVHPPIRLSLIVESDAARVSSILERNPSIGDLVRSGWLGLYLVDPDGGKVRVWDRRGGFTALSPSAHPVSRESYALPV